MHLFHPRRGRTTALAALTAALAATLVATPASAAPTVSVPRAAEPAAAAQTYVVAVYDDLFHRTPDSQGLGSWTTALLSGTPRVAVANSITSSDEYRSRLITESYQTYLGRAPEPAGLASWLGVLRIGQTLQTMESGFLAAPEYYALAGGTDAGWVTRLYGHVLGRTPSDSEIASWVSAMGRGANRATVAIGFLLSSEHLSTVVDGYYRDLLGRGLDAQGQAGWVRAIQGGTRVEQIIGALVSSDEYVTAHGGPIQVTPPPAPAAAPPASGSGVGVPAGAALTVHDGDLTVTTAGAVISNLDIRGYLRIKAPNVTVQNTIVRGRDGLTGPMALVQNSQPGLRIIDSELAATYPTYWVDGFVGSNTTFTRVNIHSVVDSIKIAGDNVLVEGSWLHDNLYYASVPSGGDTHNDNIQVQRGNNIVVRSSTLSGTRNAAVMVTQDTGAVTGLVLTGNRIDNGACSINLAEKTYGPIAATITDNVFGTGQRTDHCAVVARTTTQAVSTITGNTFTDGRTFTVTKG